VLAVNFLVILFERRAEGAQFPPEKQQLYEGGTYDDAADYTVGFH